MKKFANPSHSSLSRRQFLKLAALSGSAALIGACAAPASNTAAPAVNTAAPAVDAPAPAATEAAPTADTSAAGAPVELTYIYPIWGPAKNQAEVQDAVNAMLKDEIGATVKLVGLDFEPFQERMRLIAASGEPYDIAYTANWANDYYGNVAQDQFLALDDLLPKYAPDLWASYAPEVWDGMRVKGKIYAITADPPAPYPYGIVVRKDLAEKYNLDLSKVNGYADLEPFLQAVKNGEPGITPMLSDESGFNGLWRDEVNQMSALGGGLYTRVFDPTRTVTHLAFTPEWKTTVELARKWWEAGYFTKDPLPDTEINAAMQAGKYAAFVDMWNDWGRVDGYKTKYGHDWVGKAFMPQPFITTANVVGSMNAISTRSQHPDKALAFLNALYKNRELFHTLTRGAEGANWVWADEQKNSWIYPKDVTAETNAYEPGINWVVGNPDRGYPNKEEMLPAEEEARRDQVREAFLKQVKPSTVFGFSFDPTPVQTEYANVSAVDTEYYAAMQLGLADPAVKLPEYQEKLKAAGVDKVVAEAQRQVNEWIKTVK